MRRWNHYDAGLLLWGGKERCGFVISDPGASFPHLAFIEMRNVSKEPERFFEMDGDEVREAYQRWTVEGIWHSHRPGVPQPSTMDAEWHPVSVDMYIICDLRIRRFVPLPDSIEYQEVPTPWSV